MKNVRLRTKLLISFGLMLCLSGLIAAGGFCGMRQLDKVNNAMMDRTLPNTERIWEMRRNLQSDALWSFMSMVEPDPQTAKEFLKSGDSEKARNEVLLQEVENNSAVDQTLMKSVEECLRKQEEPRREFQRLIAEKTAESTAAAYQIMHDQYLPLLSDEANLLREMTEQQTQRNIERYEDA